MTGPAFELIAELAAFTSGPARASLDSGKAWIREVRRAASRDLIERVERYTLGMYAELATVALEAAPQPAVDALIARVHGLDPAAFRLRLLGADSPLNRTMGLQRGIRASRRRGRGGAGRGQRGDGLRPRGAAGGRSRALNGAGCAESRASRDPA